MSVKSALYEDQLSVLEAMAETLAEAIDDCSSPRDLPPLVKQLREVMDEIASIAPNGEDESESMFDKLKRERAERS